VLTDEQQALQEAVRGLLTRHATSAAVRAAIAEPRGYDEKLWDLLCGQIGVAGLSIPTRYRGAGATLTETALVLEELGRTLAPTPLLGSAVLAGQALLATQNDEACGRLLPGIADGTRIAALAWTGSAGDWDKPAASARSAEADRSGTATRNQEDLPLDDWRLDGEAHYVLEGDTADVLLVAGRAGPETHLFEVDPNAVDRDVTPAMDLTRRLATVRFDATPARRLGPVDLAALRDVAVAALAAEQVGAAARALELTVEYAKTRVQFGQPIGSFQALKHRMADMYVLVESARSAAYAAAAEPAGQAAVAKVYCSEALHRVTAEMIQLHGGIAITWEHDAHLYFKRAHGSAHLFGQPGAYVARLAQEVTRL
jgi:hypothetical protein